MLTVIISIFLFFVLLCHIDKLKYLVYIPQIIWGSIKAIPDLVKAGYYFTKAMVLLSFWFVLTWGFWPLALWIIFGVDLSTKH